MEAAAAAAAVADEAREDAAVRLEEAVKGETEGSSKSILDLKLKSLGMSV